MKIMIFVLLNLFFIVNHCKSQQNNEIHNLIFTSIEKLLTTNKNSSKVIFSKDNFPQSYSIPNDLIEKYNIEFLDRLKMKRKESVSCFHLYDIVLYKDTIEIPIYPQTIIRKGRRAFGVGICSSGSGGVTYKYVYNQNQWEAVD